MSVTLTPQQLGAIHARLTATCTHVDIRRWDTTGRMVEVSSFARARLIETVKIGPAGGVKVLS